MYAKLGLYMCFTGKCSIEENSQMFDSGCWDTVFSSHAFCIGTERTGAPQRHVREKKSGLHAYAHMLSKNFPAACGMR